MMRILFGFCFLYVILPLDVLITCVRKVDTKEIFNCQCWLSKSKEHFSATLLQ